MVVLSSDGEEEYSLYRLTLPFGSDPACPLASLFFLLSCFLLRRGKNREREREKAQI